MTRLIGQCADQQGRSMQTYGRYTMPDDVYAHLMRLRDAYVAMYPKRANPSIKTLMNNMPDSMVEQIKEIDSDTSNGHDADRG